MAVTRVDHVAMGVAAGQVDAAAEIIRGLGLQVEGHAVTLAAAWKGGGSNAFQGVVGDWLGQFGIIKTQLDNVHIKLVGTKIQYESADTDQVLAANAIARILNQ
jgi:uncharacterized protein YukE